MPELPEVETVRRGLLPAMEGQQILKAAVNRPDLRWPLPERMSERLTGARVQRLGRRSKYLLLDLSTGETLLIHLGMSGRMTVSGASLGNFVHEHPQPAKHDHVVFDMENGARVTFNDARRFGAMDLMPTAGTAEHWLIRDLGPEPHDNQLNETYLVGRLAGRRSPVKTLLLDQGIIAGLGNIYVCEALHMAGIDPHRQGSSLSQDEVARLVPVIRRVIDAAIAAGGSSLRDHRQANGELGYFQHSFHAYGREGEPCRTPGCSGRIERSVQSGRSTFWCPQCQR